MIDQVKESDMNPYERIFKITYAGERTVGQLPNGAVVERAFYISDPTSKIETRLSGGVPTIVGNTKDLIVIEKPKPKLLGIPKSFTPEEVSKLTGIPVKTLRKWSRDGKLKAERFENRWYIFGELKNVKKTPSGRWEYSQII